MMLHHSPLSSQISSDKYGPIKIANCDAPSVSSQQPDQQQQLGANASNFHLHSPHVLESQLVSLKEIETQHHGGSGQVRLHIF